MKCAVIQFPGSNCDADCMHALRDVCRFDATYVWHRAKSLPNVDAVFIPGGFSYGDYLRAGCIAAHSPVMQAVKAFAHLGGLVLGICNGFQILTECGLLPGALTANRSLRFVCDRVHVRIERTDSPFTREYASFGPQPVVRFPIAHGQGNFIADAATLKTLEANHQILFRYVNAEGNIDDHANPNGSAAAIAGICNRDGNVAALMPHPERVVETLLGGSDGLGLFASMAKKRNG